MTGGHHSHHCARGKTMHVANVGDSRAVLAKYRDGKLMLALSNDQTPWRKDERDRIFVWS